MTLTPPVNKNYTPKNWGFDMTRKIVCAKCDSDEWIDIEETIRVTGQEGNVPERIEILICACGHRQEC